MRWPDDRTLRLLAEALGRSKQVLEYIAQGATQEAMLEIDIPVLREAKAEYDEEMSSDKESVDDAGIAWMWEPEIMDALVEHFVATKGIDDLPVDRMDPDTRAALEQVAFVWPGMTAERKQRVLQYLEDQSRLSWRDRDPTAVSLGSSSPACEGGDGVTRVTPVPVRARLAESAASVLVVVSAHAVERYLERVQPGQGADAAARHIVALFRFGAIAPRPAAWDRARSPGLLYLTVGDVSFVLGADRCSPGRLVARTCVARGMPAAPGRRRRRKRRGLGLDGPRPYRRPAPGALCLDELADEGFPCATISRPGSGGEVPIEGPRGDRLHSLADWLRHAPPASPFTGAHRSAYENAHAWTEATPRRIVRGLLAGPTFTDVRLKRAIAERKTYSTLSTVDRATTTCLLIARSAAGGRGRRGGQGRRALRP